MLSLLLTVQIQICAYLIMDNSLSTKETADEDYLLPFIVLAKLYELGDMSISLEFKSHYVF